MINRAIVDRLTPNEKLAMAIGLVSADNPFFKQIVDDHIIMLGRDLINFDDDGSQDIQVLKKFRELRIHLKMWNDFKVFLDEMEEVLKTPVEDGE